MSPSTACTRVKGMNDLTRLHSSLCSDVNHHNDHLSCHYQYSPHGAVLTYIIKTVRAPMLLIWHSVYPFYNVCDDGEGPMFAKSRFWPAWRLFTKQMPRSPHSLEFILGAVLPGLIILVTLIYDFLSSIHLPKSFRITLSSLASPFQNFLTIDDLEDVDTIRPRPVWKIRTLSFLALANSVGWVAYFVYTCVVQENALASEALIASLAWVSSFIPSIILCVASNTTI